MIACRIHRCENLVNSSECAFGSMQGLSAKRPSFEFRSSRTPIDTAYDFTVRAGQMTCMDARLIPAAALGLKEGDAHVIR